MELTIRFSWDFGWSDHDNPPTKLSTSRMTPHQGGLLFAKKKS